MMQYYRDGSTLMLVLALLGIFSEISSLPDSVCFVKALPIKLHKYHCSSLFSYTLARLVPDAGGIPTISAKWLCVFVNSSCYNCYCHKNCWL